MGVMAMGTAFLLLSPAPSASDTSASFDGNQLSQSLNPYLREHADNPIEWYEWGERAFDVAQQSGKLIFLSIGYLSCHWCHVMQEESFMDEEVARLLNEDFVSILVDREERPDIDHHYLLVSQLITGRGGWPLNIIMTPDGKPFFAATYIPRDSRAGRMGMIELLPLAVETWNTRRDEVDEAGNSIESALRELDSADHAGEELNQGDVEAAFRQLVQQFDREYGGFGTAPKFPQAHNVIFLLRHWKRTGSTPALNMAVRTLTAMRQGGIYDQVGYGFHRYATDAGWEVPHFEKMLYDQAMLALAYIEAYLATEDEVFADTAEEILAYVLRDLHSPQGAFFSAEDADSEGEEGTFYLWSTAEIRESLGDNEDFVLSSFRLREEGNFNNEATGQPSGLNILLPVPDVFFDVEKRKLWQRVRREMFALRENRTRPLVDRKILTDWNGLMIAALARIGAILDRPDLVQAARNATDFIIDTMIENSQSQPVELYHRYWNGNAGINGQLNDYAFFAMGLLELYQAVFDVKYLELAVNLTDTMIDLFWNEGFYSARDPEQITDRQSGRESVFLIRGKSSIDAALPSGNSIAMNNLVRLSRMTGDPKYESYARAIGASFGLLIKRAPSLHAMMLTNVDFLSGSSYEIVLVGDASEDDMKSMLAALRKMYIPSSVIILKGDTSLTRLAPYTEFYTSIDGKATAYVCQNFTCNLPTTDIPTMISQLDRTVSVDSLN